jgi:hypothetical protein
VSNFKSFISSLHTNLSGKNISKKIVVFESDDWGAIRVPSKEAIDRLKIKGLDLTKNAYTRFDGLESNSDLESLLEILDKHKDINGNHPIITANFVTCNPDFEKIKSSNFDQYFNQKISATYNNYSNSDKVLDLVFSANSNGLFLPQFHGREHVNVELWLSLLKNNDIFFRLAFEEGISGLGRESVSNLSRSIQATYDTYNTDFASKSLDEGLNYFEDIFGFRSDSFIPNNFVLDVKLLPFLFSKGVKVSQGMKYFLAPIKPHKNNFKVFRKNGSLNQGNQLELVRNCFFEPTETGRDFISTLKEISLAFSLKQPAVISTHRLNFSSRISIENRDRNLKYFDDLINSILKQWPDAEFYSTLGLAKYYSGNFI